MSANLPSDGEEKELRVLSHNVGQYLPHYDNIDTLLHKSNPDIILLQEITHAYITQHLPAFSQVYPYQAYGPLLSERRVGMGLLSRYPLMEVKNFKLAAAGLVFQQRAVIDLQGDFITVYNLHLTYPRVEATRTASFFPLPLPTYKDTIRREEVENLVPLLEREQNPIFAAGDFNLTSRSNDYKRLLTCLTDAYQVSGKGPRWSWPACRTPSLSLPLSTPLVRIDYLFHSSAFRATSARFLEKTGSDHLPLFVSLRLQDREIRRYRARDESYHK